MARDSDTAALQRLMESAETEEAADAERLQEAWGRGRMALRAIAAASAKALLAALQPEHGAAGLGNGLEEPSGGAS